MGGGSTLILEYCVGYFTHGLYRIWARRPLSPLRCRRVESKFDMDTKGRRKNRRNDKRITPSMLITERLISPGAGSLQLVGYNYEW